MARRGKRFSYCVEDHSLRFLCAIVTFLHGVPSQNGDTVNRNPIPLSRIVSTNGNISNTNGDTFQELVSLDFDLSRVKKEEGLPELGQPFYSVYLIDDESWIGLFTSRI